MKKYWTTFEGDEIEYKKLTDSHLRNILKWIERRAEDGMTVEIGGGWSPEDFWYESWPISGDEVLERYDYKGLEKEAIKRKLF